MTRRIFILALALVLTAGLFPVGAAAADLKFVDVSPEAWYYGDVKNAVETGLVNGKTETTYCPDDELTYAEAVKLAACMHQKNETGTVSLVNGDPWYKSYADYAKMKNIIAKDYEWSAKATRAGYMAIFAHALPDSSLAKMNEVPDGSIPDVPMSRAEAPEIYKLYRAGILQGSDDKFSCKPDDNIKRSEVAAILTRMMFTASRKSFTTVKAETPKTDPLKVVKSPQNYALKAAEETVAFTVEISGGKAPYLYKWFVEKENGSTYTQESSEKKTGTCSVPFGKDSFTGTKYVRVYAEVTDADGNKVTSEKAEVTPFAQAIPALKIEKQPVSVAKPANMLFPVFGVTVSGGKAPYEYKWYEDCGYITFTESANSSSASNELVIDDAETMLDQANGEIVTIWCVITDAAGQSVTTDKVKLTRQYDDLKITMQPKTVTVVMDDYAVFNVAVSGGKAPYKYDWQSIDYTGSSSLDTWSSFTSSLNGSPTLTFDAEWYTFDFAIRCVITDANGKQVISELAYLVEKEAATPSLKITKDLPSSYTLQKDEPSASFILEISGGKPPYSYYWELSLGGGGKGDTYKLNTTSSAYNTGYILDSFDYVDSAEVTCFVTDSLGNTARSNTVTVYPYEEKTTPLKITKQPLSYWASEGQEKALIIEVSGGKAPYSYEWEYNEQMNFWEAIQIGAKEGKCRVDSDGTLFITVSYNDWTGNSNIRCVVTDANGDQVISDSVYFIES